MSRKEILAVAAVSLGFYLAFFYRALSPQNVFYSGKDSMRLHYQTREFIYENITAGKIPFWTERMLLGFPIYADMERGILNPLNLLSIYVFGPINSYKILHLLFYLMGSGCLYTLLRKDKQVVLPFAAANAVYFFNFFVLFHQQHFNMVLTVYSLPTLVFLLKKYIESPQYKIIFWALFSLLFSTLFYFGSFQALLMNSIVLIWYILSQGILKKGYHNSHKLFFLFITTLVLILPGVWSQKGLYDKSLRANTNVFRLGSVSAPVLFSASYPFIFGSNDDYLGTSINGEYLMHEIYFYVGISALLIYFFGFLPLADRRIKNAHLIIVVVTVFIMIWGQLPFFKDLAFPPFSLFRYWVRAVFLLTLPLSLGIGSFLASPRKTDIRAASKILAISLLLILTFGVLNYFDAAPEFFEISKMIVKKLTEFSVTNIFWWVFLVTTSFLLFVQGINMKTKSHLLVALVTTDILVFGLVSNNKLIVAKDEVDFTNTPKSEKSIRTLDLSKKINSNNSLTSNFWNVIGYSELIPSNTVKNIEYLGLVSPRNIDFVSSCGRMNSKFIMPELGINGVIDESGVFVGLPGNIVETANVESADIEEGYIKIMKSQLDTTPVVTKISYYPGWLLYLDGKLRQDLIRTDQHGFINFTPDEESSEIVLRFVPIHLFQGLFLSIIVLWFLFGYWFVFRREIFSE